MTTRTLLSVCIALTLCATGCEPRAETTAPNPPVEETTQPQPDEIMIPADSFLAALMHCEQLPQIKQRMTTEELIAVFGEGPERVAPAERVWRGLADNNVRFVWEWVQGEWRLIRVLIGANSRRGGMKEPSPSDFADPPLIEAILQIAELRLVHPGMSLEECRTTIGMEDGTYGGTLFELYWYETPLGWVGLDCDRGICTGMDLLFPRHVVRGSVTPSR